MKFNEEIDTYNAFFELLVSLSSKSLNNYLLVFVILQNSQVDHDEVISQFHF